MCSDPTKRNVTILKNIQHHKRRWYFQECHLSWNHLKINMVIIVVVVDRSIRQCIT